MLEVEPRGEDCVLKVAFSADREQRKLMAGRARLTRVEAPAAEGS